MTGEFTAIARLAAGLARPPEGETWIGDDAAVVCARPGWLLLAADTVVAGVHADLSLTGLDDFGWKAVTVNLSDLAAMGGAPGHALVTVAGPPDTAVDALYQGVAEAAEVYGCPVVGGDLTNASTLVVTVAVTGSVDGPPVLRSGARPGDRLWVTGGMGAAAAGLRLLRHDPGRLDAEAATLRAAHARPVPLLEQGRAARLGGASAMIDVSDGFAADIGHIADASSVGFELSALPVAPGATREEALRGGDDYQLVFSAPDDAAVLAAFSGLPAPVAVGIVVGDPSVRTLEGRLLEARGWEHTWS